MWTDFFFKAFLPAYLVGSIPFGYLVGKFKGIDIRKHGSGNIGATNVWRVLGKQWGLPVFVLDFLKVPVAAMIHANLPGRMILDSDEKAWMTGMHLLIFMGAVLGHNFPVWLKFKGGKGIATSAGGLLWLMPKSFLVAILTWGVMFALFRMVSLASIAAAILVPISVVPLYPRDPLLLGFSVFLGVMAIWRHRSNIQKIMKGTEHRWTRKKD